MICGGTQSGGALGCGGRQEGEAVVCGGRQKGGAVGCVSIYGEVSRECSALRLVLCMFLD